MKTQFLNLFSTLIIILLILSCERKLTFEAPKETFVTLTQNTTKIDIEKAKFWFEKNIQVPSKTARIGAQSIKKVNWNMAM